MKIEATDKYVKTNTFDEELSKGKKEKVFPSAGFQWEVSEERAELLINKGFAKKAKEKVEEIEVAVEEKETEKAVKKTRKKK